MKELAFATPPGRILIIKPSSLGDVTHAMPVVPLLRRRWPEAHISWIVAPACVGLLEGMSGLDEVIVFDRRRLGTAWRNPAAGLDLIRFKRDLRRRQFDLVIDFQGLFRSGWMTWQTRAAVRVGFRAAREFAWLFYTDRIAVKPIAQHAIDRYLTIVQALGCPTSPLEYPFPVTPADRQHIGTALGGVQRFAVHLPGANWLTKRWPVEHFAQLATELDKRYRLASVIAGGPEIADLAMRIPHAINLAGKTTLPQLVALLDRADLVVANDSGPMHIAAALNRPLVAIFGPTNPVLTGPYRRLDSVVRSDIACSPCYSRRCRDCRCLSELGVEKVLAIVEAQLKTNRVACSRPAL